MLCPICKKVSLKKAIIAETEVDYCPNCLGLWFKEDELRQAKDVKDRNLRWLDIDLWKDADKFKISPGQKLCSSCRLPVYEVKYGSSDIKVDVCNLCRGIWLDRGEFKKIISYLREEADKEILDHYLKNLISEFGEIFQGPEEFAEEVEDFLIVLKMLNYKLAVQHPAIASIIASLPK